MIEEGSLAAAEVDSEMAYRLATYFAVEGDESEAEAARLRDLVDRPNAGRDSRLSDG